MASNPMQRKARNSFILGIVIATLICAVIIAFLILQVKEKQDTIDAENAKKKSVYALKEDIIAGSALTIDNFKQITVTEDAIPANAISSKDMFELTTLKLKNPDNDSISIVQDKTSSGSGAKYKLVYTKGGTETDLKQEGTQYYIMNNGNKEYIEVVNKQLIAKIDMSKNTILTEEMCMEGELADDLRDFQITGAVLPLDIQTGDFVDLRLLLPNGQDLIVLSKKQITIPLVDDQDSIDIFSVELNEFEILMTSCATIDSYLIPGTKLYVSRYTDPGIQSAAITTYTPDSATIQLVQTDPNVLDSLRKDLANYMNTNEADNEDSYSGSYIRKQYINSIIDEYYQDEKSRISEIDSGISDEIKNNADQRTKYLKTLAKQAATSKTSTSTNKTNTTTKSNTTTK